MCYCVLYHEVCSATFMATLFANIILRFMNNCFTRASCFHYKCQCGTWLVLELNLHLLEE